MNNKKKRVIGVAVASMALCAVLGGMIVLKVSSKAKDSEKSTAIERLKELRNRHNKDNVSDNTLDEDEVVRVVVNLKSDSVSEKKDGEVAEYDSKLKSTEKKIINKQEDIISKAEKITGNKVEFQSAYLVNSFSIDTKRKYMDELASIEGVDAVYESSTYTVEMKNALDDASVEEVWNDENFGFTGEGTVVAVIDTGVNYEHRDMLLDKEVKTKYTKQEWQDKIKLLGYGEYKTDKVPFAYNYASGENDCLANIDGLPGMYKSSICHGYHVAGISAANGKIKGVAKNAQVIGMSVLGISEDNCTVDQIVKAIEDAVKLGADVINMSLGVGSVSVNDSEFMQQAVNAATEAGVVCCISAANSGASGSSTGTNTNEMNRKDTSTIHTPGISKSALTVAASNNEKKKDARISMASFSSWGPSTELDIKPEITAPGHEIKSLLYGEKKYATMSGTSMASPYVAGCTAVLKEAIKDKNLDLSGNDLNNYMKNCLMNTADVLVDSYGNPYSVRYEGAGLVDLYGAVSNDVIATFNGQAKVELRQISEGSMPTFTIDLKNYGDKEVTYNLSSAQIYTDYTNNSEEHEYSIKPVEGAYITFDNTSVTIPAGGNVSVIGTVKLGDNFKNNQYVEAFIKFDGQNVEDLGLPVLGFYGDWTAENINDTSIYEGDACEYAKGGTGLLAGNKYSGVELKKIKVNTEVNEERHVDAVNDINVNNSYIDNLQNIDMDELGLLNKEEKSWLKDYLSKLKDKLRIYPFISEGTTTIKNLKGGMSLAIYSPKYDGYCNVNIESDFTCINLMGINKKNISIDYMVEEKNIIKNYNDNFKTNKDYIYIFIFKKLGEYNKEDKYGTITLTQVTDAEVEDIVTTYNGDKVAFSPNEDGTSDEIIPYSLKLRSAKENNIYVLDSNKQRIRTLAKGLASTKDMISTSLMGTTFMATPYTYNYKGVYSVKWDGKLYNSIEEKYEYADEGQYYIQIESKFSDMSLPQVVTMPVKIDNTKPTIDSYSLKDVKGDTVITFSASDNYGASAYYYVDIETEDGCYTFTKSYFETQMNNKGEYVVNLGNINYENITLMVDDIAGNYDVKTIEENAEIIEDGEEDNDDEDIEDDSIEFDFSSFFGMSTFFENNIITSDKLNDDGTYTTTENLNSEYESIIINGVEAKIDSEKQTFEITIPLKAGINHLKIQSVCYGVESVVYEKFFVDSASVKLNDSVHFDENNKLVTNQNTIDMSGVVSSYTSVENIDINGDSVYTNLYGIASHDGSKLETKYNCNINLQEGINNIVIEIRTMCGYIETVKYVVEYVK